MVFRTWAESDFNRPWLCRAMHAQSPGEFLAMSSCVSNHIHHSNCNLLALISIKRSDVLSVGSEIQCMTHVSCIESPLIVSTLDAVYCVCPWGSFAAVHDVVDQTDKGSEYCRTEPRSISCFEKAWHTKNNYTHIWHVQFFGNDHNSPGAQWTYDSTKDVYSSPNPKGVFGPAFWATRWQRPSEP